ncbi:MAG: hypothetical protein KAX31_00890 [Thermoplasmata archaeon]|nr:hypothetical protein [Thermoplasmata archaeon]
MKGNLVYEVKKKKKFYLWGAFSLVISVIFIALFIQDAPSRGPQDLTRFLQVIIGIGSAVLGIAVLVASLGKFSIRIYDNGFLLMTGLLENKEVFIPFENINAIYLNEYSPTSTPNSDIMIVKKDGEQISVLRIDIGQKGIGVLKRFSNEKVRILTDRNWLMSYGEIFPPPKDVEISENSVIFHGQKYDLSIPWHNIKEIGNTPKIVQKDGKAILFYSYSEKIEKHKEIRKNLKKALIKYGKDT